MEHRTPSPLAPTLPSSEVVSATTQKKTTAHTQKIPSENRYADKVPDYRHAFLWKPKDFRKFIKLHNNSSDTTLLIVLITLYLPFHFLKACHFFVVKRLFIYQLQPVCL